MKSKTALLKEFDGLIDEVESAAADPTWRLADWLVLNVPNTGGRAKKNAPGDVLSLDELAVRGDRTVDYLRRIRRVATNFPMGKRVVDKEGDPFSVSAHEEALATNGNGD